MMMPQPQEEHHRLQKLAGTWTGEETINPTPWDPKGGPAKARVEARADCDGFWVVMEYTQLRGDQVTYRGHGVFGYDTCDKNYLMFWFDSTGMSAQSPAKGRWDGNRLVFVNQTPMGHGRYSYEFEGEGKYRFRIDNSQDGKQWVPFMEGEYSRKT